jgi:D-alanyl-D-alanine carboxypeptidase/D-alanyl-D-alanine-endopeptidase (penicillin-binding protein 4)
VGQSLEGIQGTWQNGSKAVRAFLEERVRLKIDDLVLLDGSGESRYNLASPHHFVQCLRFISQQFSYGPEISSALSMSGCDGRFMKNRLTDVYGKIRAKCGTMTGISGIAGYAETKDGETLAFAIMVNGFTKKASEMKSSFEDPLCKLLVNFSRKDLRGLK